jgi:DNA-binding GntR family transcriptional regulator
MQNLHLPNASVVTMPLTEQIYKALKEGILKGDILPGQKLNEIDLSNSFGISRSPIREAIQRLANEELIKIIPYKGAEVIQLEIDEINELFDVRIALETMAVNLAIEKVDQSQFQPISDLLISTKLAIEENSYSLYPWDLDFHVQIARCSKNSKLEQSISRVNSQLLLARSLSGREIGRAAEALNEHTEIWKALQKKDLKKVQKSMIQHLKNSRKKIIEIVRRDISRSE